MNFGITLSFWVESTIPSPWKRRMNEKNGAIWRATGNRKEILVETVKRIDGLDTELYRWEFDHAAASKEPLRISVSFMV